MERISNERMIQATPVDVIDFNIEGSLPVYRNVYITGKSAKELADKLTADRADMEKVVREIFDEIRLAMHRRTDPDETEMLVISPIILASIESKYIKEEKE